MAPLETYRDRTSPSTNLRRRHWVDAQTGDNAKFNLSVSHSSSAQLSNGEGFAHQEQGQEQDLISESFAVKEVLLDLERSPARRFYPMPRRLDGHRKLQHDPDVTAGNGETNRSTPCALQCSVPQSGNAFLMKCAFPPDTGTQHVHVNTALHCRNDVNARRSRWPNFNVSREITLRTGAAHSLSIRHNTLRDACALVVLG